MKRRKTLNTIAVFVTIVGGLLVLGTLGAAERDRIDAAQAILQSIIGVGIAVLGGRLFGATYDPTDYDYEEDEDDYDNLDE